MSFAREVMRESLVEHSGEMNVLGAATQAVVVEPLGRVFVGVKEVVTPNLPLHPRRTGRNLKQSLDWIGRACCNENG